MMTSRILKILAILAVTSLVAGCKFSVIVGEGGKVQSSSGTRNCSEGSTCTFQVSDTTFSDTFTAVPLSGYKFARWQGGTDYQCANSTSPTCVVSNTAFSGKIADETISALDKVYSIKPVFQVVTAPRYVVKDGNGDLVGELVTIQGPNQALVRLLYVDEEGKEHGYGLEIFRNSVRDHRYPTPHMYYSNSACVGEQVYIDLTNVYDSSNLGPLFSERFIVVRDLFADLSLVEMGPSDQPQLINQLFIGSINGSRCDSFGPGLMFPATMKVRNLAGQFTPPFGLYAE